MPHRNGRGVCPSTPRAPPAPLTSTSARMAARCWLHHRDHTCTPRVLQPHISRVLADTGSLLPPVPWGAPWTLTHAGCAPARFTLLVSPQLINQLPLKKTFKLMMLVLCVHPQIQTNDKFSAYLVWFQKLFLPPHTSFLMCLPCLANPRLLCITPPQPFSVSASWSQSYSRPFRALPTSVGKEELML